MWLKFPKQMCWSIPPTNRPWELTIMTIYLYHVSSGHNIILSHNESHISHHHGSLADHLECWMAIAYLCLHSEGLSGFRAWENSSNVEVMRLMYFVFSLEHGSREKKHQEGGWEQGGRGCSQGHKGAGWKHFGLFRAGQKEDMPVEQDNYAPTLMDRQIVSFILDQRPSFRSRAYTTEIISNLSEKA